METFFELLAQHNYAAAFAIPILALYTLFSNRVRWLPTWDSPTRPVLATSFLVLATVLDYVSKGNELGFAITSVLMAIGPTLVGELTVLWKARHGGNGDAGTGTGGGGDAGPGSRGDLETREDLNGSIRPLVARAPAPALRLCAAALMAVLAFGAGATGCTHGALPPVVSSVESALNEIPAWIELVRSVANAYFLSRPAPEVQAKVERAIGNVALAVDALQQADRGGNDLANGDHDAAFANFKRSYVELLALLKEVGVLFGEGKLATARTGAGASVTLPEPLLLRHCK